MDWLRKFRNRPSPKSGLYADRRWYHPLGLARRIINYYLLICVALFFLQNSLLFPRWLSGSVFSPEAGAEQAAAGNLVPWKGDTKTLSPQGYVGREFAQPTQRGTIVVFHGNAGCALDRTYYAEAFARRGFRTFLYEYPGYGGRPRSPSAASIVGDAQALIRSLDQSGYGPIYVWGESVGSGVAAEVCRDPTLPVHGLALLTPWDSLTHAAATHYPFLPVAILLWDKYDSIKNLLYFQHPVCVICSADDSILPASLGRNLYTHLTTAKKLIVNENCGHNDWPSSPDLAWWDEAINFIAPQK